MKNNKNSKKIITRYKIDGLVNNAKIIQRLKKTVKKFFKQGKLSTKSME